MRLLIDLDRNPPCRALKNGLSSPAGHHSLGDRLSSGDGNGDSCASPASGRLRIARGNLDLHLHLPITSIDILVLHPGPS